MSDNKPTWGQLATILIAIITMFLAIDAFVWTNLDKRLDGLAEVIAPFIMRKPE